jgi:hypothetical protein
MFTVLMLFSVATFSEAKINTYNCKFEAGFAPDNFEKSFVLGADWVNLSAKMEDINHFFNFSIFKSSTGPYLQYFEGTIDDHNVSTPIVGSSTLLTEGQEKIGMSNFICDYDVTCWALNCTMSK